MPAVFNPQDFFGRAAECSEDFFGIGGQHAAVGAGVDDQSRPLDLRQYLAEFCQQIAQFGNRSGWLVGIIKVINGSLRVAPVRAAFGYARLNVAE